MDDRFKIYVDQLRKGKEEILEETFSPEFIEVEEEELRFPVNVDVTGRAYIAEEHLVLHLSAKTKMVMPCSICNTMSEIPLQVKSLCHSEPLSEVRGGTFWFNSVLREAILLEVLPFAECCGGDCPQREFVAQYQTVKKTSVEEGTYQPFSQLEDL